MIVFEKGTLAVAGVWNKQARFKKFSCCGKLTVFEMRRLLTMLNGVFPFV